jgi:hypothetical protein
VCTFIVSSFAVHSQPILFISFDHVTTTIQRHGWCTVVRPSYRRSWLGLMYRVSHWQFLALLNPLGWMTDWVRSLHSWFDWMWPHKFHTSSDCCLSFIDITALCLFNFSFTNKYINKCFLLIKDMLLYRTSATYLECASAATTSQFVWRPSSYYWH